MSLKEAIGLTMQYAHYAGTFLVGSNGSPVPLLHATYLSRQREQGIDYVPVFITDLTPDGEVVYVEMTAVIERVEKDHTHYLLSSRTRDDVQGGSE